MAKLKEQDYKAMILRLTSLDTLEGWLLHHPPPKWWPHGSYAWAYNEMIIGERIALGSTKR